MKTRRLLLLVALGCCWGCSPHALDRAASGSPIPVAPLAASLKAYNQSPTAVRVQGKLRVAGRGSAVFGATAVAGQGLRLDAVSGPFARPVFSLGCLPDTGCRVYLPARATLYVEAANGWGEWLGALARGRVPVFGTASAAWRLDDGARVLQLAGDDGWLQEVEFAASDPRPRRAVYSRNARVEAELRFSGYTEIDGQPFPGKIALRGAAGDQDCTFEFRQVAAASGVQPAVFQLQVPPGTTVESLQGTGNWRVTGPARWLRATER